MAFEGLSDRLEAAFKKLRSKGALTESDVKEAMREVRLALLEADVNYKVVKEFVNNVKIYTMDENRNIYQSFAIKKNKIEALGNNDEMLLLKKTNTEVIDLDGKVVVPGFNKSTFYYLCKYTFFRHYTFPNFSRYLTSRMASLSYLS